MTLTLGEVAEALDAFSDEETIYAEGGVEAEPSSRAVVAVDPNDASIPPEAAGLECFLEVAEAREAVTVWRAWRNGRPPTTKECWAALTYYAKYDRYVPLQTTSGTAGSRNQHEDPSMGVFPLSRSTT